MAVLDDAKQYLYRYGTITDTTVEPVELIRDLVGELERVLAPKKKPPGRSKGLTLLR
jgi:hypothetical protein